jgi:hypothetical protein
MLYGRDLILTQQNEGPQTLLKDLYASLHLGQLVRTFITTWTSLDVCSVEIDRATENDLSSGIETLVVIRKSSKTMGNVRT